MHPYDKVTMPDDFGQRMSPSEIEALVVYMRSLTSTEIQSPAVKFPGMAEDPDMSPFYDILLEYQKFMPEGWWTDEKVIAAGKDIYTGVTDSAVVCAACHGADGRPVLTGAADFTDLDFWESLSEPYLYWRVAAGVPDTPMTAFGMPPAMTSVMATMMPGVATTPSAMPGMVPTSGKLTEEQIWQVLAYINALAYGEPTPHVLYPAKAFKP